MEAHHISIRCTCRSIIADDIMRPSALQSSNLFPNASAPNEGGVGQFSPNLQVHRCTDQQRRLMFWIYCTVAHRIFTKCSGIIAAVNWVLIAAVPSNAAPCQTQLKTNPSADRRMLYSTQLSLVVTGPKFTKFLYDVTI